MTNNTQLKNSKVKTINPSRDEIIQEYADVTKDDTIRVTKKSWDTFKEWKTIMIIEQISYRDLPLNCGKIKFDIDDED